VGDGVAIAGLSLYLQDYYNRQAASNSAPMSLLAVNYELPENVAVAKNIVDFCNIREKPGTTNNIVGIFTKDAVCIVLDVITLDNGEEWAHIKSGPIEGYIITTYLAMGEEGREKALQVIALTATVIVGELNVRSEPSTLVDDNIIVEVNKDEQLEVIDNTSTDLITKDDPQVIKWVKVAIDNFEGYVCADYVKVGYTYKYATKSEAITTSTVRNLLVSEAKKYLGLKYVWGGNSLKTGADCSGYVRAVYQQVGLNVSKLNRSSYDMASQSLGNSVSLSNAQPGDLVFYASRSGHVNHVAMYIGNGLIIHESGHKEGCKISNVSYRKIYKIKNFADSLK
jgi:cell wall-associated NlpC family hydrolase